MKNKIRMALIALSMMIFLSACDNKVNKEPNKEPEKVEVKKPAKTPEKVEDKKPTEAPEKPEKPVKAPEKVEKPKEIEKDPEPVDPIKEAGLHDFMKPVSTNPIMEYVGNQLYKGEFVINLDHARKELKMPDLTIFDLSTQIFNVYYQNPQFGLNDIQLNSEDEKTINVFEESYSLEEHNKRKEVIRDGIIKLLKGKDFKNLSPAKRSKLAFDITLDHLNYDLDSYQIWDPNYEPKNKALKTMTDDKRKEYNSQAANVYNGLTEKRAICGGYASFYTLLARALGLEVYNVMGTSDGDAHAWSLVVFNDRFYNVDTTFGDAYEKNDSFRYHWLNVPQEYTKTLREEEIYPNDIGLPKKNFGKSYKYAFLNAK